MNRLIFKIVPLTQWEQSGQSFAGSAHDQRDGFLHFSTGPQLQETLRRHYADLDDLLLIAVEANRLGAALKWEHAASRSGDFPHLYGPLLKSAVAWTKPIGKKDGAFVLPEGVEKGEDFP